MSRPHNFVVGQTGSFLYLTTATNSAMMHYYFNTIGFGAKGSLSLSLRRDAAFMIRRKATAIRFSAQL